jgi:hypothetical protein
MSGSARPSAGPDARSAWLRNAWLLAAGLALIVPLAAAGPERFVAFVRMVYTTRIAQFSPEFRERLQRETQALYWVLLAAGVALVSSWSAFSLKGRAALAWFLGERAGDWRAAALMLVIGSSSVFVGVRAVRDVLRYQALRGLSFDEQREKLGAESPIEPRYALARDFLARNGPRPGNVLILPSPRRISDWQPHYIFLAAYLFPVRVYSGSEADLAPELLAKRGIRWFQHEEAGTAFVPEPIENARR